MAMKNDKRALIALGTAVLVAGASLVYAADPTKGAKIYNQHCVDCHGPSGDGQMPGVPDFTRTQTLFKPDSVLSDTIKTGKNVMPGFAGILTQEEIYDVIAYLRTLR
jgi:mono/diheme cytochrome c family protein